MIGVRKVNPKVTVIKPVTEENSNKIRVAAYCRVSSDSADQLNSFMVQMRYYENLFADSETEILAGIYEVITPFVFFLGYIFAIKILLSKYSGIFSDAHVSYGLIGIMPVSGVFSGVTKLLFKKAIRL